MEPMSTWQVVTAITGAVAFIITMTVWPLLSYIQRRRDGEIDRMQERQDEHAEKHGNHDKQFAELRGDIKVFSLMHEDLKSIRDELKELRKDLQGMLLSHRD